jgi:hypothetical protein
MHAFSCFSCLLLLLSSFSSLGQVREMSTDRPDTTESPYSVPAGMFQIEASFLDYSRDSNKGFPSSEEWIYGQINFKMGITPHSDLQVIVNSHAIAGNSERGDSTRASGFGDITLRYKTNLWGNDSGKTAFAVMPYVTIPTHTDVSNHTWAGGLIMPFAVTLSDRLSLGLMAEVDLVPDPQTNAFAFECLHSATLGISLTEELGMYLELVGITGQNTNYQTLFDAGLTLSVTDNLVFDAGCRLGMTRSAPDFGVFSGFSIRF